MYTPELGYLGDFTKEHNRGYDGDARSLDYSSCGFSKSAFFVTPFWGSYFQDNVDGLVMGPPSHGNPQVSILAGCRQAPYYLGCPKEGPLAF